MRPLYILMFAGLVVLKSGCQTGRREAVNAPETATTAVRTVDILYFTDRKIEGGTNPDKFYANSPATKISAGETKYAYNPRSGVFTHSSGPDDIPLTEWKTKLVNATSGAERTAAILVFVHGYNQSFADAAKSTAQLAIAFKSSVVPTFYSWPSRRSTLRYDTDEDQVEESAARLNEMLRAIRDVCPDVPILLVAHSLGTKVAVLSLTDVNFPERPQHGLLQKVLPSSRLISVALLAPDIKRSAYADVYHKTLRARVDNLNLYMSKNDYALTKASRWTHMTRARRLGDANDDLFVASDSHTIDVTLGDDGSRDTLGHGYFSKNRLVTSDLVEALRDGEPPSRRQFLEKEKTRDGLTFWILTPQTI